MVPPDESACIPQIDPAFSVLSETENRELEKLVKVHNRVIDDVVDEFKGWMDELKDEVKQQKAKDEREARDVANKKRKLNMGIAR
jgi:translation initiation factor IF-2